MTVRGKIIERDSNILSRHCWEEIFGDIGSKGCRQLKILDFSTNYIFNKLLLTLKNVKTSEARN